jgi:hypothetical protein
LLVKFSCVWCFMPMFVGEKCGWIPNSWPSKYTQWKKGDIWSMVISGTDLLEVPTKKKGLLFRAKFQGISPPNMAWNMVQYLHFWVPKFPSML